MPNSMNHQPVLELLSTLDNEALETIVKADQLSDGQPSEIAVAAALLLSRNMPQTIEAEASWERFARENLGQIQKISPTPVQKRKSRPLRIAACIAAVIVIGSVTVYASGLSAFIGKWTTSAFTFGTVQEDESREHMKAWPELTGNEPMEFDSLQEALDTYRVTELKAPVLPESLTPIYVEVIDSPSWFDFDAMYEDDTHKLGISISSYGAFPNASFEAEGDTVEEREYKGQIYYIMRNLNTNKIVWLTRHFECSIEGNYTYEDLIRIFESIYD